MWSDLVFQNCSGYPSACTCLLSHPSPVEPGPQQPHLPLASCCTTRPTFPWHKMHTGVVLAPEVSHKPWSLDLSTCARQEASLFWHTADA